MLLTTRRRRLGALAGIGLCVGALISVLIARYAGSGFFDYHEPTFRAPVVVASVLELAAIAALAAWLGGHERPASKAAAPRG